MTDSTPTTPLDLDAAIEAAARGLRAEFVGQGASDTTWEDYEHEARAAIAAIGYAALVEEVQRLREGVATRAEWSEISADWTRMRADRDAAIARAEEAEVLLRAIEDCRLDPARAIIKADALAGEAIIRARNAELERDGALAKVAAGQHATAIDVCATCGDIVTNDGGDYWAHYRGPGSRLNQCQIAGYGPIAEPAHDGAYFRAALTEASKRCSTCGGRGLVTIDRGAGPGPSEPCPDCAAALTEVQAGAGATEPWRSDDCAGDACMLCLSEAIGCGCSCHALLVAELDKYRSDE